MELARKTLDVHRSQWRGYLCFFLATSLPFSIAAQESGLATLRTMGGDVLLNGQSSPSTSTIFAGTLLETRKGSSARLSLGGSTIDINSETSLTFDGDEISLDHGSLLVNTSRAFRVRSGCVVITPVLEDWTQYTVAATEERVMVSAEKKDVEVHSRRSDAKAGSQRSSLHEGEHGSWETRCRGGAIPATRGIGATKGILDSPWAIAAGVGAIVTECVLVICRGDDPVSPSSPSGHR